jgi:hypothetical protein
VDARQGAAALVPFMEKPPGATQSMGADMPAPRVTRPPPQDSTLPSVLGLAPLSLSPPGQ